jgi:ABC-type antimicrobial peptide transport system permease subunit
VLSQAVAQRTHDIGVRMALGAQRADVLLHVIRQSIVLAAAGIAIGIVAALALTRFLASLLYGVRPDSAANLGLVALLLLVTAALAALIPARRAAAVDPMVALRHE